MAPFIINFWEIPLDPQTLGRFGVSQGLWHESPEDRKKRWQRGEFIQTVLPHIKTLAETRLTNRQRYAFLGYFFNNKSQEAIAAELGINQSTVSRHLNGSMRNGRRAGGAIPKIARIVQGKDCPPEIKNALQEYLEARNTILQ